MNKLNQTMKSKSSDSITTTLKLGIQAGIFISIGAFLYSIMITASGNINLNRFLGALLFTTGLNLVVFLKAQLFTGNNLMFYSLFSKKLPIKSIFRNWLIVYFGNFIGAIIFSIFAFTVLTYLPSVSEKLAEVAKIKVSYDFQSAFLKAIYCNLLVCCAIFFGIILKNTLLRIIGIVIPITAFVYFGFEHSIANMFFIPLGLINTNTHLTQIPIDFINNIIPVTLGNITGGFIFSSLIYGVYSFLKKEN
jgi:formate/nitrite transporter